MIQEAKGRSGLDKASARRRIARAYEEIVGKDYFQVLGVKPEDPKESIRAAFKELAKQWHADAYPGLDLGEQKVQLDEIFKYITQAHETLTHPTRRQEYLIRRERESKGMATDVNAVLRAEQLVDEAILQIRRKQWDAAIQSLNEAIRLNPDDPLYSVHLGWASYNHDRKTSKATERAVDIIITATKRQENNPLAYQYLGQIFFALGNTAEARRWWKKCLEWDPKNIDASRGLRLLNQREEKNKGGIQGLLERLLKKK